MEVHAHTHTARKKCPPDRTGRDTLFLGVFNVVRVSRGVASVQYCNNGF